MSDGERKPSLIETQRAVYQLSIAFWFAYLPVNQRRHWEPRDPDELQRVFNLSLIEAAAVGLTAEQVADAAFYGRRLALAGNTPVCVAGRTFAEFASDVEACVQRGES